MHADHLPVLRDKDGRFSPQDAERFSSRQTFEAHHRLHRIQRREDPCQERLQVSLSQESALFTQTEQRHCWDCTIQGTIKLCYSLTRQPIVNTHAMPGSKLDFQANKSFLSLRLIYHLACISDQRTCFVVFLHWHLKVLRRAQHQGCKQIGSSRCSHLFYVDV